MALVVEDGSCLSNAESYASVAYFISHHTGRGNAFTASASEIEQALRKATDYMETRWATKWSGIRQTTTQALAWPRISAYYPDDGRAASGVPIEVKRACVEYALRSISEPLAPDPVYSDIQAPIIEKEERVGPIMEKTVYGGGGASASFRKYPIVDESIKMLLSGSSYLNRV